jgi:hypothetical protein
MGQHKPLIDIQADAVAALRRYRQTKGTAHLRAVGQAFVDAREHFFTRTGDPDWLGATHAYRLWTRECIGMASFPDSEVPKLQAAIRYHTGNALRDKLPPEDIADLGLRTVSPRERAVEKREKNSETLNLFSGGAMITDPEEAAMALNALSVTLRRVSRDAVAGTDAAKALREIQRRAGELAGRGTS